MQIHLQWVPGHMNIYGNEKADEKAKIGSKLRIVHHEVITSLSFLKGKVKECCLKDWHKEKLNLKNKNKHYQQFDCILKWETFKRKNAKKDIIILYLIKNRIRFLQILFKKIAKL